jgi:hypothetical protein
MMLNLTFLSVESGACLYTHCSSAGPSDFSKYNDKSYMLYVICFMWQKCRLTE